MSLSGPKEITGTPGEDVAPVMKVINPATLARVGQVRVATSEDWSQALAAASAASQIWRNMHAAERARILGDVAAGIRTQSPQLARLHAEETGQPYAESLDAVTEAAAIWSDAATTSERRKLKCDPEPVVLAPRSTDPLLDWARLGSRALLERTAAVCALDPKAPLTVLSASSVDTGLPVGLLALLVCERRQIPNRASGARTLEVQERPHGSEAIYIHADADLELAATGVAGLRLKRSGQLPFQSARVYVEQSLIYRFADALHAAMAFLEVGDPVRQATDLGPLGSAAALDQVIGKVGEALRCEVLLKLGGRRYQPWGLTGYFFQPTLLIEGRERERAPDDQIAGPVVLLSPVRNLAEALADRPAGSPISMRVFAHDAEALRASLPAQWRRRIAGNEGLTSDQEVALWHESERDPRWFPYQARAAGK